MRFSSFASLVPLALLVAPALATPAVTLQAREAEATLTCTPTTNKSGQKYTVTTDRAQTEMKAAGFAPGKSGDPHRYYNGDGIIWGNNNCDSSSAILLEYPVYRQSLNKSWQKDTPTNQQTPTPIRVVYANANGAAVYGVMIHSTVNSDESGSGAFIQCK